MVAQVQVTCLCGRCHEILQLTSDLPIAGTTCSCNACRYITGALYLSCLPLLKKPGFTNTLRQYDSSHKMSRHFCGHCGSHMLIHLAKDDSWNVCTGVVDRVVEPEQVSGIEHHRGHEFVADTVDGGLTTALAAAADGDVSVFLQGPNNPPVAFHPNQRPPFSLHRNPAEDSTSTHEQESPRPQDDQLCASCHCGGVAFTISRPDERSRQCSSPWPDLLVPYHTSDSANPSDVKWWLRANDSKYLAGTCACRSCRLGSGSVIQTWAFIPKANISCMDGTPLDFSRGPLGQVQSSAGRFRHFCSQCGATVFWHCDERPDLLDVSVGLLRASEGARAETWLEWWTERVSFKEDALDHHFVERLEKGLRALRLEQ